jgi:hypothetical protein
MMFFFSCFRFKCVIKFSLLPCMPHVLYVFLDGVTVRIFGDKFKSPTAVRISCNTDLVPSSHIHINHSRLLLPFGIFQV